VLFRAMFECLGEKDFVMYGLEPVVLNPAVGLVQLNRQSW